ncbi:MAG TPA: sulfatase-like hydrolase/transferase, partial [Chitinophagaceae bacterium]|nr:sulfatase-like hydrolase/transferase [Chitinophagaceae bacterium]
MRFLLLLLIPLFFILHGVNENYGLIPFSTVTELALKYVIITVAVYLLSSLTFRSPDKRFLFSFFLLVIYFFFGAFHDLLRGFFGNGFIVSYKFILPFLLVIIVLIYTLLRRNKKSLVKATRYLNLLMIVFVGWEIISGGLNLVKGSHQRNDLSSGQYWYGEQKLLCPEEKRPDIFFVVLDGYTSSACLKEQFGFDNSRIDSLFHSAHFYISDSSKSNYNVTPFSLASTFNLDYLRRGVENKIISSRIFMQSEQTLKNAGIPYYLSQNGYNIKNFGCFDLKVAPLSGPTYFQGNSFRQIDGQTLSSRIRKDIWWNFSLKNIFRGTFRVPNSYKIEKNYHISRNLQNFENLKNELNVSDNRPRFVYCHLMIPHEPFYLKEDGSLVSDSAILTNNLDQKEAYLNQVKYVNKWLETIIRLSASPSTRNRVVIIEGDHGYRFYDSQVPRSREFMNLNAYYFSDGDTSGLYPGISPVNSFRVVMNKYFCDSLPMLRDSSIY